MFLFPFVDDLVPLYLIPTLSVYKFRNQWKQRSYYPVVESLRNTFKIMVKKVVVLVLSGMFLVSTARSQSDCEPISFVWEHPSSSKAPVKVKCSDSTRDFVWSIGTEPHDWELPESTLASMPLAVRYETFYQLSLSRGTFAGLVEEAKQTLELSDVE